MALVQGPTPALPPPRVRLLRFRHAAEPLRQRRPARPLARLGAAPARDRAEHLRLRADHRGAAASSSATSTWSSSSPTTSRALARRPLLVEHVGAAAAALVLPLRRRGRPVRARQPRDAGREAPAAWTVTRSLMATTEEDRGGPHRRAVPRRAARRRPRDLAERREDHATRSSTPRSRRPRGRWRASTTSSTSTPTRCWRRRPTDGALVNVTHLIPRSKEDLERRRRAVELTAALSRPG